jgi:hypothetical protein
MHLGLLASIGFAGLLLASPAMAAEQCCQEMKAGKACCQEMKADMPCCQDHKNQASHVHSDLAVDPFFQALDTAPPVAPVPARQSTVVWFNQPVRIGNNILQGRYVIEHDNDRMAAGGPCTYIYKWEDQKIPVVAFHCVHLDRPGVDKATVVLNSGPDGFKRLVEFQFPGDAGGHGVPTVR